MKIGIAGSGMIVRVILDLLTRLEGIEACALWCRPENAGEGEGLGREYGLASVYTDYDEFLADPSFDLVYVGLVNSLHHGFSLRALQAGKSVVCEKPFTSTRAQAEELLARARERGLFVFESVLPWYQKNYGEIARRLPEVGDVRLVEVSFSQYSRRYAAYKEGTVLPVFDPELEGGALADMGVYSVHWVMGLFGVPEGVTYLPNTGFNGIDLSGVLVLDYGSFKAVCSTAKDSTSPDRCVVQGDAGYILQPGEPARCEDVVLVPNGGEPQAVDVAPVGDGFECVWRRIAALVGAGDLEACYAMAERVVGVMGVMERARTSAGIQFPSDRA